MCRNQHPGLRVAEDVVLFQDTFTTVEDADAAVAAVENLVTLHKQNHSLSFGGKSLPF